MGVFITVIFKTLLNGGLVKQSSCHPLLKGAGSTPTPSNTSVSAIPSIFTTFPILLLLLLVLLLLLL